MYNSITIVIRIGIIRYFYFYTFTRDILYRILCSDSHISLQSRYDGRRLRLSNCNLSYSRYFHKSCRPAILFSVIPDCTLKAKIIGTILRRLKRSITSFYISQIAIFIFRIYRKSCFSVYLVFHALFSFKLIPVVIMFSTGDFIFAQNKGWKIYSIHIHTGKHIACICYLLPLYLKDKGIASGRLMFTVIIFSFLISFLFITIYYLVTICIFIRTIIYFCRCALTIGIFYGVFCSTAQRRLQTCYDGLILKFANCNRTDLCCF